VALYRFLFAPVLLAVAVLTTSPHRAPARTAAAAAHPTPAATRPTVGPAPRAPSGVARAVASHPSAVH
jgi:hypothetical protein